MTGSPSCEFSEQHASGFGCNRIGPPTANAIGIWRRAHQPAAAGTAVGGMALGSGAGAPLNRPVQRGMELVFDTGCAIRTAQVTRPFDRSPLSVPSREVYERSTAGTSQVSRRSAETGAAPASWKLVYPWPVVAFCSPCADHAGAGCRLAWSVQSDTPISAGFS